MNNPIIIIGAGYGGLCAALKLGKQKEKLGNRKILLIDRGEHLIYSPLLYEVATGYDSRESLGESDREVEEAFMRGAAIPYDSFADRFQKAGIQFRQADVTGVDVGKKEVVISDGQRIAWDYLVVAVGAETDFYGIPGLEEHSFQLKSMRHALAIRRKLRKLIMAKSRGEESHISVVIGGAGATGVEFAAELVLFFRRAVRKKLIIPSDYSITLVEAGHKILSVFPEQFSAWAKKRLEKQGVTILADRRIQSVEQGRVMLGPTQNAAEAATELEADVMVWTGGIRAPKILENWGFITDKKGRVEVNEYCEAQGTERLYAIGDVAALHEPASERTVPSLAQTAMKEGHIVAHNIIADISGGKKQAYQFPFLHSLVPLGGKYALANVFGFVFRGFLAWVVRQVADLRYFLHVLPWHRAIYLRWKGLRVFIKNDG